MTNYVVGVLIVILFAGSSLVSLLTEEVDYISAMFLAIISIAVWAIEIVPECIEKRRMIRDKK